MDNQTRNELKRQKHADDQAHIIRVRNAEIRALQAEKGRLQRALQERPGVQENPRPLTPDAITDEMVERVRDWAMDLRAGGTVYLGSVPAVREMLTAALTEPTRPEGAEEIESFLAGLDYMHDETGASRADLATLANDLAMLIVEQP